MSASAASSDGAPIGVTRDSTVAPVCSKLPCSVTPYAASNWIASAKPSTARISAGVQT